MTAKERVLAIRVAEKVRRQPKVAARAGVSAETVRLVGTVLRGLRSDPQELPWTIRSLTDIWFGKCFTSKHFFKV